MSSACMCHLGSECVWCEQGNEIKRLREALKFYADTKNHESLIYETKVYQSLCQVYHQTECKKDGGTKARQALGMLK